MALNFPDSPIPGQQYVDPNGNTWEYNGTVWNILISIVLGGSNTQVLFNDAGTANGSANLTFNKTTSVLTVNGNVEIYGNLITPNLNVVLNDITNQFDNVTSVFLLKNDQSNVINILNSKDVSVTVGGQTLAPYVTQLTWPWFVDYDSWRGFRIKSNSISSSVIIYNSPAIGDQSSITITNNSSTIQTRRYPFAPETIALGDE
jgi:hypothetical protein